MKTENKGRLSEREGVLYVLYEEKTEEGEVVKNLLKIEKELLRASLKKSGAVSWKMVFEQGKYEKQPVCSLFIPFLYKGKNRRTADWK